MRLRTSYSAGNQVRQLYRQAQIPYEHYYGALYAAFNSWYRTITECRQDTEALTRLVQESDGSFHNRIPRTTQTLLRPYMYRLYALTNHRPLAIARWSGRFESVDDYDSLVWFWYAVRCNVVHGESVPDSALFDHYVKQAYETLQICMAVLVLDSAHETHEIAPLTPLRNAQNTV